MRFHQYLNEEYAASFMGDNEYCEGQSFPIFKNPSASDYKELRKASQDNGRYPMVLRTIVDVKRKNIFVWDATMAIHVTGFGALKAAGEIKVEKGGAYNLLCGSADLEPRATKLSGANDYLSFIEYIRYYGSRLGSVRDKEIDIDKIVKDLQWIKKYYKSCEITGEHDIRGPRFVIG